MSRSKQEVHKHRARGHSPAARARSLPYRRVFVTAMFWAAVHYLCLIATATCVILFIIHRNEVASIPLIAFMILSVLTWIWAFFQRRNARCPLCKGTPLLNSGALPHGRAVHLPMMNHGVTATLSLLFTQSFRCMYCGNLYDLLKPSNPSRIQQEPPKDS